MVEFQGLRYSMQAYVNMSYISAKQWDPIW